MNRYNKKRMFGKKTKKSKKHMRNKHSIRSSKKMSKCNTGLLGAEEDVFTLDVCKKYGGSSSGIQLPSVADYYSPISGIASAVPNGLTGSPINQSIIQGGLPGTTSIDGNNNYYSLNTYTPIDISRQMLEARGGMRRRHKTKKMRKNKSYVKTKGGGLYQQVQNFGRGIMFDVGKISNGLQGYPAPVNPSPTVQYPKTGGLTYTNYRNTV